MGNFILTGLILACFSPMFIIHGRRLNALRQIRIETADQHAQSLLKAWKANVKGNCDKSNAAVLCLAGIPIGGVFGPMLYVPIGWSLILAILIFSSLAVANSSKVNKLAIQLGFPKGYKWIMKQKNDKPVPSLEDLEARSILQFDDTDKAMIKMVIQGQSIEFAALASNRDIEHARNLYAVFFAAYTNLPDSKKEAFINELTK